jgi:uncharacterized integral membrane protein (TIGR00698 family)
VAPLPAAAALIAGMLVTLLLGNPYHERTTGLVPHLLGVSIVGLGAGANARVIGTVGVHGIGYTAVGITLTLAVGMALARALGLKRDLGILLSVGTAICGGSAIAAAASTLRAKSADSSVALGTVFLLNALGLIIFPGIGHHLGLSDTAFGLWSALAIHDTSSVVGAALQYGGQALEIATTVKLVRALWIVPVTLLIGLLWAPKEDRASVVSRLKRMWFILGFVAMSLVVTWLPELAAPASVVVTVAKRLFVVTLFLIGCGLSPKVIRSVGPRALVQGVALWFIVAVATLKAISIGWIS